MQCTKIFFAINMDIGLGLEAEPGQCGIVAVWHHHGSLDLQSAGWLGRNVLGVLCHKEQAHGLIFQEQNRKIKNKGDKSETMKSENKFSVNRTAGGWGVKRGCIFLCICD